MNEEAGFVPVIETVWAMRATVAGWKAQGLTVGLVPTMGALHEGHRALVRAAMNANDRVVVSVFVNPTQFGEGEDLEAYPRNLLRDVDYLSSDLSGGLGVVFAPSAQEMYPKGFVTSVLVSGVADELEGALRPGHFSGVATVVSKLLLQVLPDRAYFGEKDFQQLHVVKRLALDLNLTADIVGVPIVREEGGLAISSRNVYLDAAEGEAAAGLNRALRVIALEAAGQRGGVLELSGLIEAEGARLVSLGFSDVEYLEVRDAESLGVLEGLGVGQAARVLGAVRIGRTRLIDNVPVPAR